MVSAARLLCLERHGIDCMCLDGKFGNPCAQSLEFDCPQISVDVMQSLHEDALMQSVHEDALAQSVHEYRLVQSVHALGNQRMGLMMR